jgi:hypothetical protein
MQTNDMLILADSELVDIEQNVLCFLSKPRQELNSSNLIYFNSMLIILESTRSITITQSCQIAKIESVQIPSEYIA